MEWQPIDSAPKDGTEIILGRFTGDPNSRKEGRIKVDFYRRGGDTGYVGFGEFNAEHWPPTHWMPLPPPPQEPRP